MAYLQQDDEEQKKIADPLAQQQTGGGSNLPSTGGGGVGAAPNQASQQGFGNILDYLNANQGQATKTADAITQDLGTKLAGQKSTIDTAAGNAIGDINKATVNYDPGLVSGAVQNPAEFVKNPENVSKFTSMRDASYKGPGSFEDTSYYGGAANAASQAAQQYQLGQGSLKPLVTPLLKNPTAGKVALDTGILQSDPNATKSIKAAIDPFKGISSYLAGRSTEVGTKAGEAKKATDETFSNTKQALEGAVNKFSGDLSAKTAEAQKTQAGIDSLRAKLAGNEPLTFDELSKLGIVREDLGNLRTMADTLKNNYGQNFDVTRYFNPQPGVIPTPGNVASKEDYATEQALQQLMGQDLPYLNESEAGLAGTAPAALAPYDMANAYKDASSLLGSSDRATLEQYKGDTASLVSTASTMSPEDLQTLVGAMQRNRAALTDDQKKFLGYMEGTIESPYNPSTPSVPDPSTPSQPTIDPYAPPKEGEDRTKFIETAEGGQQMWWNGSSWVKAPEEYAGMTNGQYTLRFNYNTGEYEPIPTDLGSDVGKVSGWTTYEDGRRVY